MSNINKVIFDGRISRAPELKYLQTGTAIANFSVAVSGRKNQNGAGKVEQFRQPLPDGSGARKLRPRNGQFPVPRTRGNDDL